MNRKDLQDHVQQLCDEHGHVIVLDAVRTALECYLEAIRELCDQPVELCRKEFS